jgi:hypothetical protein
MKNTSLLHKFFLQAVPADTLGLFRIAVSGFALVQLLVLLPDWMWLYGPQGILPWEVSEALATNDMPSLPTIFKLLSPLRTSPVTAVYLVTAIYFFSLLGLVVGYKTRMMGILAWLTHLILNTTGHFTAYGVETFTHISLFYCMVLPVGIAWSLDNVRRPSKLPPHLVTLSIRVVQLHLCIMYLASGIEKAMGDQWWTGEAVWIALQQDQFHQVDTGWMAATPIIPKILCWSTLVVETLYPFGMLWEKTRKFWLPAIVSMHLFIALFLGLHLFGALMILLNVAAFSHDAFPSLFTFRRKLIWGGKNGGQWTVDSGQLTVDR